MRTTLHLPEDLLRQLKTESVLRGLKLQQLIADLIRSGLAQSTGPLGSRVRSPLPVIRRATGQVYPAWSNRELEDLLTREDADAGP